MKIYLNGDMIDDAEARIGHNDAALQHAVGLFETMSAFHGRVFRLDAHLKRLADSAARLGLGRGLDTGPLGDAVATTLKENKLERARIRLTMTPGPLNLMRPGESQSPSPTVIVVASEPVAYDPAYFERGIMVTIGSPLANPFDPMAGHKTLNYWSRLYLLRQAATLGAGEAIVLNITNHLAGGAISNLFLVKDGSLLTPLVRGEQPPGALNAPVLPGITRAAVIALAEDANIPVVKRMLSIDDLLDADEVFLTNSSWHVLPVTSIEKRKIGRGKIGPLTDQLRQGLDRLIEAETAQPPDSDLPNANNGA